MNNRRKLLRTYVLIGIIFYPYNLYASFIESTTGTAVVKDATATYYNPAALTLLKNSQFIALGSIAYFHTEFKGQITQSQTGFTQSGTGSANTKYYLPDIYLALPITKQATLGFSVIYNDFRREVSSDSILRYAQSNNHIINGDIVTALGVKLNKYFAIGAGIDLSRAHFIFNPTSGFPTLNIPDRESQNESSGTSLGGHIGMLFVLSRATVIGFNHRTMIEYNMNGKSVFKSTPPVVSEHYHFKTKTPARSVASINHFVTDKLGFIGTVQRIEWSALKGTNIYGLATQIGGQPIIIPKVRANNHLHDTWILTVGSHYRIKPNWIVRFAVGYNQSPADGRLRITLGDSVILAASMGYDINKNVTIDCGYGHIFIKNQTIDVARGRNIITGVNKGVRDGFSLKLTLNNA